MHISQPVSLVLLPYDPDFLQKNTKLKKSGCFLIYHPETSFCPPSVLPSVKLDGGSSQGKDKGKRGCRRDVC